MGICNRLCKENERGRRERRDAERPEKAVRSGGKEKKKMEKEKKRMQKLDLNGEERERCEKGVEEETRITVEL